MKPKFSICIPNYNYEHYIDITLSSVNQQHFNNFEVLISDNASTDKSIEVIKAHANADKRISYKANPSNIGFAGNLDEAGRMAQGDWMIMLSSDDVIKNNALEEYDKFIQLVSKEQKFAFCSTFEKIDSNGGFIEFLSAKNSSLWLENDIDTELSTKMGYPVYKVANGVMLNRCLTKFLNPFNFASTCYPQHIYTQIGGYGGGRLYNPDKWFHWKILTEVNYVYYLDAPLFQYRWHSGNQATQQSQSQVLKYWLDEYRNCFEISEQMRICAELTQEHITQNFINHCILPFVYKHLKSGNHQLALRIFNFGKACYPKHMKKNKYYYPFNLLLKMGKPSYYIARLT